MAVTGHFTQERWLTNGVVTHTIDYGYDVGGKLVSAGDASSQYLYAYDANGHLDVVTESGSGVTLQPAEVLAGGRGGSWPVVM